MQDIIELAVIILFIGLSLAYRFLDTSKKKRMSSGEPISEDIPKWWLDVEKKKNEQLLDKKAETVLEDKQFIKQKIKNQKELQKKPVTTDSVMSKDELKKGIILSTILGPPKSRFRTKRTFNNI